LKRSDAGVHSGFSPGITCRRCNMNGPLKSWNARSPASGAREEALELALKIIRDMPIREQDNLLAANMRNVAERALEAEGVKAMLARETCWRCSGEGHVWTGEDLKVCWACDGNGSLPKRDERERFVKETDGEDGSTGGVDGENDGSLASLTKRETETS